MKPHFLFFHGKLGFQDQTQETKTRRRFIKMNRECKLWIRNLLSYNKKSPFIQGHVLFQEPLDGSTRVEPPIGVDRPFPDLKKVYGYVELSLTDDSKMTLKIQGGKSQDAGDLAEDIMDLVRTRDLDDMEEDCDARFHLWAVEMEELKRFLHWYLDNHYRLNLTSGHNWQRLYKLLRPNIKTYNQASALIRRALREGSWRHPLRVRGLSERQIKFLFRFVSSLVGKPNHKMIKLLRFLAPDSLFWPKMYLSEIPKAKILTHFQYKFQDSEQGRSKEFNLTRSWTSFRDSLPSEVRRSDEFAILGKKMKGWIKRNLKPDKSTMDEWFEDMENLYLETTELSGESISEGVSLALFYQGWNELRSALK